MSTLQKSIILILLLFGINVAVYASETDEHKQHHPHHLSVFIGATSNLDAEHTDFTLGVDYEYKIGKNIGIGLLGETVFAEHREVIVGIPVFYHLNRLKFLIAPGILSMTKEEEDHSTKEVQERLLRIGIGYDIHRFGMSIVPVFNVDFIGGHVSLVYGLGIGKGF